MRRRGNEEQSVARAVAAFALTGLVVVALLGVAAVAVLRSTATREALDDARAVTALAGTGIVAPALTSAALAGDPEARAGLRTAAGRVLGGPVVRIKIWDRRGRIVWSDEPRLVGRTYELDAAERRAIDRWSSDAEVSDLTEPENRFERGFGRLVEVYQGIRAPSGSRFLFETYQRSSAIQASGRSVLRRFVPLLVGALVVLELLQIPLAYLLARRLRDRQRERQRLLQRAVDASSSERRAIAVALHEGPVQELAGVSFALAAGERGAAHDLHLGAAFRDAAVRTRGTMRDLRALLVDLHPPALHRQGLRAALGDALEPLREAGVAVTLDVAADLRLPEDAEELLFRCVREAVQNVRKHAHARSVEVRAGRAGALAWASVVDDGAGFHPGRAAGEGHVGLTLLDDLVRAAGGGLTVRSASGTGTTVRVEVPL